MDKVFHLESDTDVKLGTIWQEGLTEDIDDGILVKVTTGTLTVGGDELINAK